MAKAKAESACRPPKPTRDVPYFLLQAHEVWPGDDWDLDWTLSWDREEEMQLREKRNKMIEAQLKEGKTVAYRQSGWSLWPKVHSNDLCCYIPVRFEEQILERGTWSSAWCRHKTDTTPTSSKRRSGTTWSKSTGSGSRTSKAT